VSVKNSLNRTTVPRAISLSSRAGSSMNPRLVVFVMRGPSLESASLRAGPCGELLVAQARVVIAGLVDVKFLRRSAPTPLEQDFNRLNARLGVLLAILLHSRRKAMR
jgi:hypothetical protein